jgi:predicted hotdog family 3-hydroxylacyl-ACP dehydratase
LIHDLPPTLQHADIAKRIPHHGSMCLLHEVLRYDDTSITCLAISHRSADNPLREHGALHGVCGVEYAAQAMAVHGALLAGSRAGSSATAPRGGRLAGVRTLELYVDRLDNIADVLEISATQIMGDANSMVYEFTVSAATRCLLKGRATVVLLPQ